MIVLGDFIDCYPISDFSKDPERSERFEDEIEEANRVLDKIDRTFPKAEKVYIFGNHEDRLTRYIALKARALHGLIRIEELVHLRKRGWEWIPYGGFKKIGKLVVTHGTSARKHSAAAMLEKYGHSVMFGHVHTIQSFLKVNALGEEMIGMTCGWLGDAEKADYIKDFANWCHGFATVEVEKNDNFHAHIHKIVDYRVMMNGKLCQGPS